MQFKTRWVLFTPIFLALWGITFDASSTEVPWEGTVLWNGSSIEFDVECGTDLGYNQNLDTHTSAITNPTMSTTLINDGTHEDALALNFNIKTNMGGDDNDDVYRYKTYYTGVVANSRYAGFINDHLNDTKIVDLAEYGYTKAELSGRKVAIFIRGIKHEELQDVPRNEQKFLGIILSLAYDFNSGTEVRVEDSGDFGETVWFTLMVYDPKFISVTGKSLSNVGSASNHEFMQDKTITVTSTAPMPDSFDASSGNDTENDNIQVFAGISGLYLTMDPKLEYHRIKFRYELEKWQKAGSGGTATVEVAGASSRYACGTDTARDDGHTEMYLSVITCANANVCRATFDYKGTTSGYDEFITDEIVYIEGIKTGSSTPAATATTVAPGAVKEVK